MPSSEPLASRYRPDSLAGFVGQEHLVGSSGPIRKFIESKQIPSMIFWGPPGTGKTTLAFIISQLADYDFHKISAVMSGKAKLKQILAYGMKNLKEGKKTILFIDEIHRWNKAQQDALLPFVEKGVVTLIGATTENPSFTVISALLSRARVFVFKALTPDEIISAIKRVMKDDPELKDVVINKKGLEELAELANGDLRKALNVLEAAMVLAEKGKITDETIAQASQRSLRYDKAGDQHYDIISAVHKSLRSSQPTAACYWIRRMLDAGEDPLYIARRLLRFASEDIGNADPHAVILANTVFDTCHKLGMPECDVHLMQLAIYLAKAPKDNSAYVAGAMAAEDVRKYGNLEVPMHIRNAPTGLMKDLGYGKGYQYDHDLPGKKSDQQCMPDELKDRDYLK